MIHSDSDRDKATKKTYHCHEDIVTYLVKLTLEPRLGRIRTLNDIAVTINICLTVCISTLSWSTFIGRESHISGERNVGYLGVPTLGPSILQTYYLAY